jgi:hypothetical protein
MYAGTESESLVMAVHNILTLRGRKFACCFVRKLTNVVVSIVWAFSFLLGVARGLLPNLLLLGCRGDSGLR